MGYKTVNLDFPVKRIIQKDNDGCAVASTAQPSLSFCIILFEWYFLFLRGNEKFKQKQYNHGLGIYSIKM